MDVTFPIQNGKRLQLDSDRNSGEGKSRICSLPDSILKHILSFLRIEEAVRTSVLSKRWVFLWASIPKLEFFDGTRLLRGENFMNFVEKILLLRDSSNIHTFRLNCKVEVPPNGTQPRINSWIYAALRHKVQKMILRLSINDSHGSFVLPRSLFDCESLNELELDFSYDLKLPSFIYFPNLKILRLSEVIFMDYNSVNQLFSSCPNLEKLDLIECQWDNVKTVHVSAPMLEHLKIVEVSGDGYREKMVKESNCCRFIISGPRLKFFYCQGELFHEYCISEAPSLVGALVGMYSFDVGTEIQAGYHAHKLLEGLSNVKDLHVSCLTLKVLTLTEDLFPRLPLFHNLKQLEVSFGWSKPEAARRALLKILHNSPHLESIYFASRECLSMFGAGDGWQLDPVPPCFLTHLKIIKFEEFGESREELNALKIMLKSARALEKIDLGSRFKNRNYNVFLDFLKECMQSDIDFR